MIIKVRFYGDLAREIGTLQIVLKLDKPIAIREVLEKLLREKNIKFKEILNDYTIIVNGMSVKLDYIVKDSCEIKIIPIVRGG